MRYTPEHQKETRRAILAAATKLFKEKGYTGVSIDAIADAAKLTSGALYSQFASKQELFDAVLDAELAGAGQRWAQLQRGGKEALSAVLAAYLSMTHRGNVSSGCPVASLSVDAARCTKAIQRSYGQRLTEVVDELAKALGRSADPAAREPVWAFYALLVGGMVLARAVYDESTASEILASCRKCATEIAKTLVAT